MPPRDDDADRTLPGMGALYADRQPSPDLEDRVVADLVGQGLLVASRRRRLAWWAVSRAAAAAIVFAAGWVLGARPAPATAGEGDATYMLLLWEDGRLDRSDPPETVARAYAAWARDAARAGVPVRGDELSPERVVVGAPPTAPTAGGAFVGGYFLVGAPTADAARRLAEGHPHVERGGWIEVAGVVPR